MTSYATQSLFLKFQTKKHQSKFLILLYFYFLRSYNFSLMTSPGKSSLKCADITTEWGMLIEYSVKIKAQYIYIYNKYFRTVRP